MLLELRPQEIDFGGKAGTGGDGDGGDGNLSDGGGDGSVERGGAGGGGGDGVGGGEDGAEGGGDGEFWGDYLVEEATEPGGAAAVESAGQHYCACRALA